MREITVTVTPDTRDPERVKADVLQRLIDAGFLPNVPIESVGDPEDLYTWTFYQEYIH